MPLSSQGFSSTDTHTKHFDESARVQISRFLPIYLPLHKLASVALERMQHCSSQRPHRLANFAKGVLCHDTVALNYAHCHELMFKSAAFVPTVYGTRHSSTLTLCAAASSDLMWPTLAAQTAVKGSESADHTLHVECLIHRASCVQRRVKFLFVDLRPHSSADRLLKRMKGRLGWTLELLIMSPM